MARTITKQDATRSFDEVLVSLPDDKDVIVDEDGDRDAVAVTPEEEFDKLSNERFWSTVDRMRERNAHLDPEQVLAEITKVVEEVRQEQYERQRAATECRR